MLHSLHKGTSAPLPMQKHICYPGMYHPYLNPTWVMGNPPSSLVSSAEAKASMEEGWVCVLVIKFVLKANVVCNQISKLEQCLQGENVRTE